MRLEKYLGRTIPTLITPVAGAALEKRIRQPGCNATDPEGVGGSPAEKRKALADYLETNFALSGDALLYFGPKSTLVRAHRHRWTCISISIYVKEMDRRYRIIVGKPLGDVNSVWNAILCSTEALQALIWREQSFRRQVRAKLASAHCGSIPGFSKFLIVLWSLYLGNSFGGPVSQIPDTDADVVHGNATRSSACNRRRNRHSSSSSYRDDSENAG